MISLTCFSRPFMVTLGGIPVASADSREEAWGYVIHQPFKSHTVVSVGCLETFGGWDVVRRPEWLEQHREAA